MKFVTKYSLCALVSIGLACTTNAKPDDEKEKEDKGKPDKVEVYPKDKEDKEHKEDKERKDKVPVVEQPPGDPTHPPFSVPEAGSTAALLGLSLAGAWLAKRRWASSLSARP
jgi:hypothetical protein